MDNFPPKSRSVLFFVFLVEPWAARPNKKRTDFVGGNKCVPSACRPLSLSLYLSPSFLYGIKDMMQF